MTRSFHGPIKSADLKSWYRWLNRAYFNGTLPIPRRITYTNSLSRKYLGMSDVAEDGRSCKCILIDAKTRRWPKLVLQTMLHEMCHVKHPGVDCSTIGQRNRFHVEIRRLEKEGAFLPLL